MAAKAKKRCRCAMTKGAKDKPFVCLDVSRERWEKIFPKRQRWRDMTGRRAMKFLRKAIFGGDLGK